MLTVIFSPSLFDFKFVYHMHNLQYLYDALYDFKCRENKGWKQCRRDC